MQAWLLRHQTHRHPSRLFNSSSPWTVQWTICYGRIPSLNSWTQALWNSGTVRAFLLSPVLGEAQRGRTCHAWQDWWRGRSTPWHLVWIWWPPCAPRSLIHHWKQPACRHNSYSLQSQIIDILNITQSLKYNISFYFLLQYITKQSRNVYFHKNTCLDHLLILLGCMLN